MKRILLTIAGTLCASLPLVALTTSAPETKPGVALTLDVPETPMVTAAELMQNPKWIEAFVYSFTPLTDVEPTIDAITRDFYQTLQPVITAEKYDQARKMLMDQISAGGDKANASLFFTLGAIDQQIAGSNASNRTLVATYVKEAAANYNKAIDAFGQYQRAHRNLGLIYMNSDDKNDIAKAIPHLEKAVALGARDSSTYAMLGYCNFLQGNLFSAENAFKTALTLDNTNKDVYQLLAQVLLQESRYKEARSMFSEMIKDNPNNEQWWMAMVNTYLAENDLDNCVVDLEVLRHMKKAETQSLYLLGNIYLTRNMYDMATEVYCQAIDEAAAKSGKSKQTISSDIDSALDSGRSLAGYSAFDLATRILDKIDSDYSTGIQTDEQQMEILTLRSNINIAQGNGEAAAKVLQKILERDPLNGDALNALASYYCEMIDVEIDGKTVRQARDLQMAIMMLERAEDVNDNRTKLRAFTQHARLMVGSQDTDSLRKAVGLLQHAQSIEANDGVEQYIQEIQKAIDARSSR